MVPMDGRLSSFFGAKKYQRGISSLPLNNNSHTYIRASQPVHPRLPSARVSSIYIPPALSMPVCASRERCVLVVLFSSKGKAAKNHDLMITPHGVPTPRVPKPCCRFFSSFQNQVHARAQRLQPSTSQYNHPSSPCKIDLQSRSIINKSNIATDEPQQFRVSFSFSLMSAR